MTLPRNTAGSPAGDGRRDRPGAPTGPDDAALMAQVVAGDAAALEILYARYGRASYALARRLLGDEGLAQDVVQEVFLTVWRDAAGSTGPGAASRRGCSP